MAAAAASDTRSNSFCTLRRPLPRDIPELRTFLTTLFESGEFGRDLSFGELEIQDYLDWFLPRALVDSSHLLYVLDFHPQSSSRTYKPTIIGCCYIALSGSTSCRRPQTLAIWRLRLLNALSDIQVWPNRQAAEVHRRFQRARQTRAEMLPNGGGGEANAHLLLAAIQDKYRGVGLGTKMLSWAEDMVKGQGCQGLFYVGNARDVEFMRQCGISSVQIDGVKIESNDVGN